MTRLKASTAERAFLQCPHDDAENSASQISPDGSSSSAVAFPEPSAFFDEYHTAASSRF